jgi:hypothetical protein
MDKKDLLDLINDDDLGLLDLDKKSVSVTPDDRLSESFMEINEFFSLHNAEPKSGGDIHEHKLASRLKHIRENKEQRDFLSKYDTHNLLKVESKDIDTVSDIFEDDDLDLLILDNHQILTLKNVPSNSKRINPGFIARRKPCLDFNKFDFLFTECHKDLKEGIRKIMILEKQKQVQVGTFFVLNGILGYVQKEEGLNVNEQKKIDGRLRVIFENGTESNILFQSLIKAIQENENKIVSSRNEELQSRILDVSDTDNGYIYILKSLSLDIRIANLRNLYKIGFSTTTVEQRIQHAEKDPTYLMAQVSLVSIYKCFNMNPQRFERLLHRFFGDSCLHIEIIDTEGRKYIPNEWFIAPIEIIDRAIELIIKGEIISYLYDKNTQSIIKIK